MMQQYRSFWICGGAEGQKDSLLGLVSRWYPNGSIDYVRPAGSMVELTRFQLRSMTFDEKGTAELFGLEIARLLVDSCYRDMAIARYETEKRLLKQDRFRH
jgi:hypothetical protein